MLLARVKILGSMYQKPRPRFKNRSLKGRDKEKKSKNIKKPINNYITKSSRIKESSLGLCMVRDGGCARKHTHAHAHAQGNTVHAGDRPASFLCCYRGSYPGALSLQHPLSMLS